MLIPPPTKRKRARQAGVRRMLYYSIKKEKTLYAPQVREGPSGYRRDPFGLENRTTPLSGIGIRITFLYSLSSSSSLSLSLSPCLACGLSSSFSYSPLPTPCASWIKAMHPCREEALKEIPGDGRNAYLV